MKTYLKIFVAFVLIIGTLVWAVTSARSRSYSGTALNIDVGAGAVTVTNSSELPVSVQLVSPGTRSFAVASTIDGTSGSSTTLGSGSSATQVFEFTQPFGVTQFTVTRGTNVSFVTSATTNLEVSVQPLTETDYRMTIIVALVVILGVLFYISKTTDHRWIPILGRKVASDRVAKIVVALPDAAQGPELRAYGDNRADKSIS